MRRIGLAGILAMLFTAAGLSFAAPGALAGSSVGSFEIEGNLIDDSGLGEPLDWQTFTSPPFNRVDFSDKTGKGDDIFGLGSKELEPGGWQCVTGSAPGKDDIKDGSIGLRTIGGKQFLYVKFFRAAVNGDAHIDYEFNKSTASNPSCPALPARTSGDVLLSFDTENGGATIIVRAFEWQGDASIGTFNETPLGPKGVLWDGAVNIPNTIAGETAGNFGEASLNLTATIGAITCGEFGTAYMKSRASTAINAALKDRTAPKAAPGECAKLTLDKSADKTTISPPGTITYTLTYSNTSDVAADGVVIKDSIPAGTEFVSCTGGCTVTGGVATWSIGTVPARATGSVTLTVRLLSSAGCQICNVASIAGTGIAAVSSPQVCVTVVPKSDPTGALSHDSAFGASVKSGPLAPINQTFVPVSSTQSGVGSSSQSDEVLNVEHPDNVPGPGGLGDATTFRADVLRTVSTSTITQNEAIHESVAEAAGVNILNGVITADAVRAVAMTTASGTDSSFSSAGSTFKNLVIQGVAYSDVKPGTVIDLNPLVFGAGSYVKLYERVGSTSGPAAGQLSGGTYVADLKVNMITVHATSFAGQAVDIVVSNAVAHSEFKQTRLCVAKANQSVSGDGFIARAATDPTLLPIIVGQVSIPGSGGTDEQSLSTVRVPDTGAAAVTASTSSSKSTGTIGVTSKASTYAHAEDVCVLRDALGVCTVSATVVQSQSNSEAKNGSAASDDAGTQLLGLKIAGVAQSASPPRNTTVTIPGIGFVTFNEQFC
ncbi:MAG: DUF11 domain-containing protein, partial [Mycobacteriales bacterium]